MIRPCLSRRKEASRTGILTFFATGFSQAETNRRSTTGLNPSGVRTRLIHDKTRLARIVQLLLPLTRRRSATIEPAATRAASARAVGIAASTDTVGALTL